MSSLWIGAASRFLEPVGSSRNLAEAWRACSSPTPVLGGLMTSPHDRERWYRAGDHQELDLSPAPAPAPPLRRILRHGLIEARLLIRNGEQLLLALVIPLAILVAGRFARASFVSLAVLGPSVLALAVWSSPFTSVAITTAFDRQY